MGYLPTELGQQQQDARPYGAGVREQEDAQARRLAEMTSPPASPRQPTPHVGDPTRPPIGAPPPLPGGPPNPGSPMDADPRDESARAERMWRPSAEDPLRDTIAHTVRRADTALMNLPLVGGLYSTLIGNPVKTLQMVADAFIFEPGQQVAQEERDLKEWRDALTQQGIQWWRDPAYNEAATEAMTRRVIMGATGDLGGVPRLTRATAQEVTRLSTISQRLRAIGAEADARAIDNELSLASGARPEGAPTREHLEAFEDILSTKQTSGHYTEQRRGEQASDMDYYSRLRKEVERREADAQKAEEAAASGKPTKGGESGEGDVQQVPGATGRGQRQVLPDVSQRVPEGAPGEGSRVGESAQGAGAQSGERGGEAGQAGASSVRDVRGGASAETPPGLQQAAGRGVDVSATPPGSPPSAGGGTRLGVSPETPSEFSNIGINLDKIDAPQHVKDLIESEGIAHLTDITAQRRGVQTLDVTYAKARNLGIEVPNLAKIRPGTAFNAEGAVALFNSIVKVAEKRLGIEEEIRAAGPLASPEMQGRWLAAVYDQNTLQRIFAGGRAELGRGLRALRELSDGANSGQMKDTFSRALDAIGGKKNFDTLLQRLRDIQTNPNLDPWQREIAAFKFVGQIDKPKFWDKINEAFINSILSNPQTWTANALGQQALLEAEVIAQFPAAAFDTLASGFGKVRPRERTITGAVVQAVVAHTAMKRATQEALLYLRDGITRESVEKFRETGAFRRGHALEGSSGRMINAPTTILGSTDAYFYALGYQRQLYQDAANFVARDGKDSVFSRSFWRRVADVAEHPEEFLMDNTSMQSRAEEAGKRAGLRQDAGDLQKDLQNVLHWEVPRTGGLRPGVFVAPFVRIGFNLARVGAEYSPLGFVRVASQRGGTQADAFGRAVVGSSLWWAFWQKADAGELTGPVPSDPRAQQQFYDEGKRPYAMRIGDQWVEYGRYEPIATTLKWIYGFNQAAKSIQGQTPSADLYGSALLKAGGVVANSMLDSSYLSGINDIYDLANANEATVTQKAARVAGNLANALIPFSGTRRFIAQREDPTFRNPQGTFSESIVQQIEASTPGLSHLVKPYLTHWGEPSKRPDLVWGLSASREARDLVDEELSTVVGTSTIQIDGTEVRPEGGLIVGLVQQDIASLDLSPDEAFSLQQVAGRAVHDALATLFADQVQVQTETGQRKSYSQMSDREKTQSIQKTISDSRRVARATVADAILLTAETDGEVKRAAKMRLATISKVTDRAAFLSGLSQQGKLSADVRRYLNEHRDKGERTVEQYLQLARGR